MLSGFLSQLFYCRLGNAAWSLVPSLPRGNPPTSEFPSITSAASHGSQASPLMPPPHSVPLMLWCSSFLCLSLVIRLLSTYCSVGYSRWFLYSLIVIPDWSWEEVSVASTYSSIILGLSELGFFIVVELCDFYIAITSQWNKVRELHHTVMLSLWNVLNHKSFRLSWVITLLALYLCLLCCYCIFLSSLHPHSSFLIVYLLLSPYSSPSLSLIVKVGVPTGSGYSS